MTRISDCTQMKQHGDIFMTVPPSCWFTAYKYLAKGSFQISSQDALPAPSVPVNTLCISLLKCLCLCDEKGKEKEWAKKEEKGQESRKYRTQNPGTSLCLLAQPQAKSNTGMLSADDTTLYKPVSSASPHCSGDVQFAFGTSSTEHHHPSPQQCWTDATQRGYMGLTSLLCTHIKCWDVTK